MSIFNNFIKNAGKPSATFLGRLMLAGMNCGHQKMALWCIDNHIKLSGNESVLDVGCGGGQNIANFLKRTNGIVCGIDYSLASVEKSLNKNKMAVLEKRSKIVQSNVSAIPFENEIFDLVTAFETIYFWEDIINDFKEIKRVLKPNGKFVVCNEASKMEGNERWTNILDMNIYTAEEIVAFMHHVGFVDIKTYKKDKTQCICVIGENKS
ncbi:MAG TPA: class I SAM-dependent methyltransferase [Chitinophagales bacterium]|nr:class I SAM-dependent methyltransferase [Bacteroidales bacterium]HQG39043.1 class I SAM-dependent methyltransferase [Chitinophagales bacterium]